MKIPLHKKWFFIEQEDYANYLYVATPWQAVTKELQKFGFRNAKFLIAVFQAGPVNLIIEKKDGDKLAKHYFYLIKSRPELWHKLHQDLIRYSKKLWQVSAKIGKLSFKNLTNREILNWYLKFQHFQKETHIRRGPMWFMETERDIFGEFLRAEIFQQIKKRGLSLDPNEAFTILTTPAQSTKLKKEKVELMEIVENAKKRSKRYFQKALILHTKKYEWLAYGLEGPKLTLDYFRNETKDFEKIKNLSAEINKLKNEEKEISLKQRKSKRQLQLNKKDEDYFRIAREAIFAKAFSKEALFYGFYCLEGLLKEIAKRTGLSLKQMYYLVPSEFKEVLINKKDLREETQKRMKFSLFFCTQGKAYVFSGKEARLISSQIIFTKKTEKMGRVKELQGLPAVLGRARGKIKVINKKSEIRKMKPGDILVSHMTNPELLPAMKKAAAIVTDMGGIICHAAIVARELGIPCVIGTKFATRVFKDGDLVEVDATTGVARLIKRSHLTAY